MRGIGTVVLIFLLVNSVCMGVLLTAPCSAADGQTYYVGGNGSGNYTTIQSAINSASDGDTIYIYNGTYYEHVTINKALTLNGEYVEDIIIDGNGIGDVIVISADGVTISNVTITNSGSKLQDAGIEVSSSNNTITRCIIKSNLGTGVNLSDSSNNFIYQNNFIENNKHAFDHGMNSWDAGYQSGGNFWDDYEGEDADKDGVGDVPYPIPGNTSQDSYPFTYQDSWINIPPFADAGGPYYGIINSWITFDGSGSSDVDGTIVEYEWDFGETYGHTGRGVSVPHQYSAIGNYTVTLTVTDNDGATMLGIALVNISENNPPNPEAGGPYTSRPSTSIRFDASSSTDPDGTINSYQWDFGDGFSATGIVVYHTYTELGKYTVTLTTTDDRGASSQDTTTVTIAEGEVVASGGEDLGLFIVIFVLVLVVIVVVYVIYLWKYKGFFEKDEEEVELCPCPYCGHEIPFDSTKCSKCGKEFRKGVFK